MYVFLILDKIVDILYNNNCKEELTLQIRYYMEDKKMRIFENGETIYTVYKEVK